MYVIDYKRFFIADANIINDSMKENRTEKVNKISNLKMLQSLCD